MGFGYEGESVMGTREDFRCYATPLLSMSHPRIPSSPARNTSQRVYIIDIIQLCASPCFTHRCITIISNTLIPSLHTRANFECNVLPRLAQNLFFDPLFFYSRVEIMIPRNQIPLISTLPLALRQQSAHADSDR